MKSKLGRKTRETTASIMVGVRVSDAERKRYLAAADKLGCKTLSEFLRVAAGIACEKAE